jgi:hypothetical protein
MGKFTNQDSNTSNHLADGENMALLVAINQEGIAW